MSQEKLKNFIDSKQKECLSLLYTIYHNHNPDPLYNNLPNLSPSDINKLSITATINELSKKSVGNGNGLQTISQNLTAFASVAKINNNKISNIQQQNIGNGFAPNNSSTWIDRSLSDHMRRGNCNDILLFNDIFNKNYINNKQIIKPEPIKINLKPDWNPDKCNFLNGQKIDSIYIKEQVWCCKGYFAGSMTTSYTDYRQITIIFEQGSGVIQSPHGLLSFKSGDIIQIPQHTPFCLYINKNNICKSIIYYSKENLIFPNKQLNVSDLNQIPFSPSNIIQCKYSFNESKYIKYRPEYVRIEQCNDNRIPLFYFEKSRTPFDWNNWVHQGPVVHKVNIINDFERIGTNLGHKDPNIWLILAHSNDPSFGIAFITEESVIQINNINKITYTPAYFHLNGVHEKGELIKFNINSDGKYDARKGFDENQCLLHCAGVGHGGDIHVFGSYLIKAIIKYILINLNKNIINNICGIDKYIKLTQIKKDILKNRINNYIKYIYSNGNVVVLNENESIEKCVKRCVNNAIDYICDNNNKLDDGKYWLTLGMPSGLGYLLVESRNMPIIPKCEEFSKFRESSVVSYGVGIVDRVDEANLFLSKICKSKSNL